VLKREFLATALAVAFSGALVGAQAGSSKPAEPQTQPQAAAQASQATTTLTGCVYREEDVPGRAPNPAERAGVLEDYILAEVSAPGKTSPSPTSTPGATGTSGIAQKMYKLELVDDEKLKTLVGKRVEVIGRIDAEAGDATKPAEARPTTPTDKAIGRDRIDLPEFEVSTIREIAGTCPAKPSGGH
jgi:hypothetical protein